MAKKFKYKTQKKYNEAVQIHSSGNIAEAKTLYEKILKAEPKHIDALLNYASCQLQQREYKHALNSLDKALALNPKHFEALSNKGATLQNLYRFEEALECYCKALIINPRHADTLSNHGVTLGKLGRFEEALEAYDKVIILNPRLVDTLSNRGVVLKNLGRFEEALESYNKALSLHPRHANSLSGKGVVLGELKRFDEALESLDKVIALDPKNLIAHTNRGSILKKLENFDEAVESFNKALKINPNHVNTLFNQGAALENIECFDEAIECYDKVIDLNPHHIDAYYNRSLLQLLKGDLHDGWENFGYRKQTKQFLSARKNFKQSLWDGRDITGKTLLIYPEQGFGDIIQFIRYAKLLKQAGARFIFSAPANLYNLISNFEGIDVLLKKGDAIPAFDYHASIMDLPKLFNTTLENIPSFGSYLQAPDASKSKWAGYLGDKKDFRLGIVYAGNPKHENDRNRSIDPVLLEPLLGVQDVSIYSLQVGRNNSETDIFGKTVVSLGNELTDYTDTAAVISQLDLVLTVDTSVAHLAGALGTQVWTLLPKAPDWRWLLDRDDSPWYPSMKLFRQRERGNWPEVIERVKVEFETLVKGKTLENQNKAAVLCDRKAS